MKLERLDIQAFKAFGETPGTIVFGEELTVVYAPNSQGKTSLAEALEFLFTGTLSRRGLMGSAPREFADCLRHAHATTNTTTQITLRFVDATGGQHILTRTLLRDIAATRDCESRLELDGATIGSVEETGLRLATPPLQTPILLQHALRYVLSAKPQERTDYFKALLQVDDLDRLRQTILDIAASIQSSRPPLWSAFVAALDAIGFAPRPSDDSIQQADASSVARLVAGGLATVMNKPPESIPDLNQLTTEATGLLETGSLGVSPAANWRPGEFTAIRLPATSIEELTRALEVIHRAGTAQTALLNLAEAALALPELASANHPIDCPLCLTESGLGVSRIASLKELVTSSGEVRAAHVTLRRSIDLLRPVLERHATALAQVLPRSVRTQSPTAIETPQTSGGEQPEQPQSPPPIAREQLTTLATAARAGAAAVAEALSALEQAAGGSQEAGSVFAVAAARCAETSEAVQSAHTGYTQAIAPFIRELEQAAERATGLNRIRAILEFEARRPELIEEARLWRTGTALAAAVRAAAEDIGVQSAAIADLKYAELSGAIGEWWQLLRPEEVQMFAALQRAGSGRRFLDIKASLGGQGVGERDAVAVFSDSQLNCLGLAAFLARVERDHAPFVVLDDPVQASDEDHRYEFSVKVPKRLIANGCQTVVLTHDARINRDIQHLYSSGRLTAHVVEFDQASLSAAIKQTSDTVDAMITQAAALKGRSEQSLRERMATILRKAAERLCKIVIVERESVGGVVVAMSSLNGEVLSTLIARAAPYLDRDVSHPGKLRSIAENLNPGSHDNATPPAATLTSVLGELKYLRGEYS